jgi:hypothetical protein
MFNDIKPTRSLHFNFWTLMRDKIWFTYKARIQAQARLSWLDFHSQLLLVWYAIFSACLAVITIRYPQALGKDTDVLSAVLSIALLGISLAVANRDFRGRAIAMRRNYLQLQELYDQTAPPAGFSDEALQRYHSLLSDVENHSDIDDKLARTTQALKLTSRVPSWMEVAEAYGYLARRLIITILLYIAPFGLLLVR